MAVPNFSFDFSAFNPMVQALATYMPRMLATKAREQEALSPLVPTAARASINRSLSEEDRADRESRSRISGETMAQALQNRLMRETERRAHVPAQQERAVAHDYGSREADVAGPVSMVPGMGRRPYGAEYYFQPKGGVSYGGPAGDESGSFEQESAIWNANRCKADPYGPGCPGAAG